MNTARDLNCDTLTVSDNKTRNLQHDELILIFDLFISRKRINFHTQGDG